MGSDKLVTPTNAVLTEVFTGVKPDKVIVLAEEQPRADVTRLAEVLDVLGINAEIAVKVIGTGVKAWREGVTDLDLDMVDVTPGRKYMAYAVLAYSRARDVRYVYLKEESKGYHMFGYVPFDEVKVYDMRTGEEVPFDPPKTRGDLPKKSNLTPEGLTSLVNLYSLLGKVEVSTEPDPSVKEDIYEEGERLCKIRAGFLRFEEENQIRKLAESSYFIADTNVYIVLGTRIARLVWANRSFRLLPSKSVYKELSAKTESTQKDEFPVKFYLGMQAFRELHPKLPEIDRRFGDIALLHEVKALKSDFPENIVLITGDKGLVNAARSQGVKCVHLSKLVKSEDGDWGEYISCMRFFANVKVTVDGREAAVVRRTTDLEQYTEVEAVDLNHNYPKVVDKLELFLGRKKEN